MPRWDRPLDHQDNPYGVARATLDRPRDRTDAPSQSTGPVHVESEWGLWLSVAKAMLLVFAIGMVLINGMYGAFELLHLLGG